MDNESTPRLLTDLIYRASANAKRRDADFNLFDAANAEPTETVLARHDQTGPYSPENCVWREARTARERRTAIEDC